MNTTTSTNILRAATYGRVSGGRQVSGTSLEAQDEAMDRKAAQIGATVAPEAKFCDVVSGGYLLARPGMQAALAYIEAGHADVLIMAKLDRMSRDRGHQDEIKRRVRAAGARLVFCDMDFDDTPEGDFVFNIIGDYAVYEREVIGKRTESGRRKRALSGIQSMTAMPPFGYYLPTHKDVLQGKYPPEDFGKYQIVEEAAALVRMMYAHIANGGSMHNLTRRLNEQGIPTPRGGVRWYVGSLRNLLQNPAYKGKAQFGRHVRVKDESRIQAGYKHPFADRMRPEDEWITIECPPIVSEVVWDACQKAISENRARHGGRPDRKYMLSGLLCCPQCKRAMQGRRRKRKTAGGSPYQQVFYNCPCSRPSLTAGGPVCVGKQYAAHKAESYVVQAIAGGAHRPEAIARALSAYHKTKVAPQPTGDIKAIERELETLQGRETATVEAQIRGIQRGADATLYENALGEIAARRQQLQRQLTELKPRPKAPDGGGSTGAKSDAAVIAEMLEAIEEVLTAPDEEVSPNEKREALSRHVQDIYPADAEEGFVVNLKPCHDLDQTVQHVQIRSTSCHEPS